MSSNQQKVAAIIAAGGESRRMGSVDKVFAPLAGRPVLARVLDVCQRCPAIDEVVVVVGDKNVARCQQMVDQEKWSKVSRVCAGGLRRQDSVLAGLKAVESCDWVVIHDGARPLLTEKLITDGLQAAQETGAAVAAVPVTDTIKLASDDRLVRETLPRETLWAAQTPQVFRFDIITEAYRQVAGEVTDDAALVERMGRKVKLYMGSYENIKVTTPTDLLVAEILWQKYGR